MLVLCRDHASVRDPRAAVTSCDPRTRSADLESGVTDVRIEAPGGVLLIAVPAWTTPVLKVAFGAQPIMPPWRRRSGNRSLKSTSGAAPPASLRANATLPRLAPRRCATRTAQDFSADHFGTRYNPLLEVRKGPSEVRDVQNIADILVDPEGALERRNHWEKTSHALLVGVFRRGIEEVGKSLKGVVVKP